MTTPLSSLKPQHWSATSSSVPWPPCPGLSAPASASQGRSSSPTFQQHLEASLLILPTDDSFFCGSDIFPDLPGDRGRKTAVFLGGGNLLFSLGLWALAARGFTCSDAVPAVRTSPLGSVASRRPVLCLLDACCGGWSDTGPRGHSGILAPRCPSRWPRSQSQSFHWSLEATLA